MSAEGVVRRAVYARTRGNNSWTRQSCASIRVYCYCFDRERERKTHNTHTRTHHARCDTTAAKGKIHNPRYPYDRACAPGTRRSVAASGRKCSVSQKKNFAKELDLYVNMVQCVSFPGTSARFNNVDITIIRQNVEGEYSMLEHQTTDGVVESLKIVTEENAKRIARYAFEHAINNGRKKVTIVHKANIMKLSDGLFLETARSVGEDYPEIACNDMIVDNACMQLVSNPHQFDMILTSNLYGSVISNVVCGLLGGVGIYSGRNVGENHVIFEPATRNSGHSIAGKNIANPVAMLHAASDMLQHLGLDKYAELIKAGIRGSLRDRVCTPDLGGTATSQEVVASIMKHIEIALQSHQ
ncbi:unnamed protein product [Trichogramma brassicae]|uniref:Isopropylmalate dehydrogenase-like domain-containing protein n=1 Tax=Trichogramma brassicae TaxID=86971 RepID=A0A6H5J0L0_9HYME|nr:unnamed protein product [Trichogramma brassicae]